MNFTTGLFLSLFATQQVTPAGQTTQGVEKTHNQSTKVQHTSEVAQKSFDSLQTKNAFEDLND